ncbi:hypothetical protein BO83DRAFT_204794 [Aspergillus eucalypticola CBS 122712]|uniref:Uncharacterized protein n=1 Tax=Aspergillus eucalypticola (strain CBS 122712 / IBT 29274) TaxID=1448314 RepID=A0A317W4F1_ASPEC|nr:uncharacterized protein BO83DRAFT_204794 [Aspergillus eucalypticola CBS 122712]PWY80172.1 hypothetical protein BO83DRAFT_204794 [Aspergillus eucalypticola CBS 122712]
MCLAELFPSTGRLPGLGKKHGDHAISYCSIASFQLRQMSTRVGFVLVFSFLDFSRRFIFLTLHGSPDTRYWPACQAPGTPWEASDPSLFVPGRAEPISHTPAAAADRLAECHRLQ